MKVIDPPVPTHAWANLIPCRHIEIEDGYESIYQISAKINRGITQTKCIMAKLVKDGKATVIMGNNGKKFYKPVSVKSK